MPWLARLAAVLSAVLHTGATPAVRSEPRRFHIAPPPTWVERVAIDTSQKAPEAASDGIDQLLVDTQVLLGTDRCQRYFHSGRRVLSTAGIQNGSEIRVDFDPQYQQLVLHGVWLHRDGKRIASLQPDELKVIQREPDLDRQLYDGMLTAILFVKDVRAGDVIEYAYTLEGSNPIFGDRFAGGFGLAYGAPVGRLRIRIVSLPEKALSFQAHGLELPARISLQGGRVERVWERTDVLGTDIEDNLPPGYEAQPWLQVTEFASWNAVATWAAPLFRTSELSPAMAERVGQWQLLPAAEDRALAALRFVQDEVRYLGIEIGSSSYQPHEPALVFAWRFGDCKDKSLLLVTLLRALGVEAAPALVNTSARQALDGHLPSPLEFDHAIVRARIGGKEYWMDPTRSFERGSLATLRPPPFRRALLVDPGASSLLVVPEPPPVEIGVEHAYRVPRFGKPVSFDVLTQYSGAGARSMRERLANTSPKELQKGFLDYYARAEPQMRVGAPLEIQDNELENRVTLHEHYLSPEVSEGDTHGFVAEAILSELALPKHSLRSMPLNVHHPIRIREVFRIDLPGVPNIASESREVHGDAMQLSRSIAVEDERVVVRFSYESLRGSVEAAAAPKHLAALREMRDLLDFSLPLAVKQPSSDVSRWWLALAALTALLVVGVAFWGSNGDFGHFLRNRRAKRRKREFIREGEPELGESPTRPLRVSTDVAIHGSIEHRRCGCGGKLESDQAGDHLILDGRRIEVHNLSCALCKKPVCLYFVVG